MWKGIIKKDICLSYKLVLLDTQGNRLVILMEYLIHYFPVSGVRTYIFLPPMVMLAISSIVSLGGVSGAFILLPFQMSILGYTSPGVSATNFVYNIVSIPSGIYKYIKNKQLCWTLFFTILVGSVPGVFIGYYVRIRYLPDPAHFKIFVGIILGLLGIKTLQSGLSKQKKDMSKRNHHVAILKEKIGFFKSNIYLRDTQYEFSTLLLGILSFFVGIAGASYGIGGGAILAPFCVSVLELPVYIVSGAALFSTWINSIIAAIVYAGFSYKTGTNAYPDWQLGSLFGLGGIVGIYIGSSIQKWVPEKIIRLILGIVLIFISARYILVR